MQGLQLDHSTNPDAAGKAGASLTAAAGAQPVDAGATSTAAEQVAAGIMMGGAAQTGGAAAGEAADMQVD